MTCEVKSLALLARGKRSRAVDRRQVEKRNKSADQDCGPPEPIVRKSTCVTPQSSAHLAISPSRARYGPSCEFRNGPRNSGRAIETRAAEQLELARRVTIEISRGPSCLISWQPAVCPRRGGVASRFAATAVGRCHTERCRIGPSFRSSGLI